MRDRKPKNLASNFLWAGLLALLGFLHPMFFLGSAFVAWLAWQELKNPDDGRQPVGPGRRPMVAPDEPHWEEVFVAACDSPAEEAFVRGAIRHFALQPSLGLLRGSRLALQLQVQIGHFRVDFLANEWLVIEIDGAAWHSSEEAVKRDAERDRELTEDGYRILRLPAKLVFNQPAEAIRRVEEALAAGQPVRPNLPKPEVNFGKAIAGIGTIIDEVNSFAARQRAVEQAMRPPRDIFSQEQMLLELATDVAKRKVRTADLISQSPEHARHYNEAYDRLSAAMAEQRSSSDRQHVPKQIRLMPIMRPADHPDTDAHRSIQQSFHHLVNEREAYFRSVREQAAAEPRLEQHAREFLATFGCERLWDDVIGRDARRGPVRQQLRALADNAASIEIQTRRAAAADPVCPAQTSSKPLRSRPYGLPRGSLPQEALLGSRTARKSDV